MRRALALLPVTIGLGLGANSPVRAQATGAAEAWRPPTLTSERYDEDWSALADPAARGAHWTGQYKYVPLGDDAHLITGAELRSRFEDNRNPFSGDGTNAYLWLRAMPYADLHAGVLRAFVEPIAAYAVGVRGGPGPTDATRVDLLQGFIDLALHPAARTTLIVRGGRQQIALGTERLVGTRYGPNVPLAYDGFRAIVHEGSWRATGFWVRPVESRAGTFDDRSSPTRSLWGLYSDGPVASGIGLDLYYIGFHNDLARYARGRGREQRHTVGARFHGSRHDWTWNLEAVSQFGDFAGTPIRAWSTAAEIGHAWPRAPLAPALTLRSNLISGDGGAGSRHFGSFNALFPKGKYFGELSPVGPRNLVNVHAIASVRPARGLTASVALLAYWRMRATDGIYDIPGNLVGLPPAAAGHFIGKQAELALQWRATSELTLAGSLSAMEPGGALIGTGHGKTISMVGLEANFRY